MAETSLDGYQTTLSQEPRVSWGKTLPRILKYAVVRAITLSFVILISVFLTVLITSKSVVIESELKQIPTLGGWFGRLGAPIIHRTGFGDSGEELGLIEKTIYLMIYGLTYNLGIPEYGYAWTETIQSTTDIILDALPRTLLLFGTANITIFLTSVFFALYLTSHYRSLLDRFVSSLSPLSAVPAWLYGVVLNVILMRGFHVFTAGRLDGWPGEFSWSFVGQMLRHMGPAFIALFISKFFQSVYIWRTFFMIFANEDYIDLARAKGVPEATIRRRYILRPLLPNFVTTASLMFVNIWQEAIILELFFSIVGIGHYFYTAIKTQNMALVIGLSVTFAYLLAFSVFLLDVVYALVDPRVSVGEVRDTGKVFVRRRKLTEVIKGWVGSFRLPHKRVTASFRVGKYRVHRIAYPGRIHGANLAPPPVFVVSRRRKSLAEFSSAKSAVAYARSMSATREQSAAFSGSGRNLQTHSTKSVPFWAGAAGMFPSWREVRRYPSAVASLIIIAVLVGVSVYALVAVPYDEVARQWNDDMPAWVKNPENAMPEWVNIFRKDDLPIGMILTPENGSAEKLTKVAGNEMWEIDITFPIDYHSKAFPDGLILNLIPEYEKKLPMVILTWVTPDGREIEAGHFTLRKPMDYDFVVDKTMVRNLNARPPKELFFFDPENETQALSGNYQLRLKGYVFEEGSDIQAEFHLVGKVFGLAGTDTRGRNLVFPLIWGAPIALAFGFFGAVGTSLSTMIFAAIGSWFGGLVDAIIQRITEINMILPAFPIMLIVYNFYSKSFWVVMTIAVLLSVFGGAIKSYRSVFLQVKQSPYIEAAKSYGAGNYRLIFVYLIPRIIPVLIPQLVTLIPAYVFLEATLAFLNMTDPRLPTWGKMIRDGINTGGLSGGAYHLVLEPVGVLLLVGFAFLMLGFTLEKLLNPVMKDVE